MTTFAEDILKEAAGEKITGVVIGEMGWPNWGEEGKPKWDHVKNKLITWKEAFPLLNYEYDTGYGSPHCQAIYAWTKTRVIYVAQYDGSTTIHSIYRNPVNCLPEMHGG
jgi:hypothetical protein